MSKNKGIDVDENPKKWITVDPTLEEQLARALSIALKEVIGNAKAKEPEKPELDQDFDSLGLSLLNHDPKSILGLLIQKHEQDTNTTCILSRPHRKTRDGHNSVKTRRYNIVVFKGKDGYTVCYPKFTNETPELRPYRESFKTIEDLMAYLRGLPISSWYVSKLEKVEGGR
ncbi:MAG: hypothetical protein DRJ03_07950 [Chloroflexi bacterium]|nr:MAG: hypothetical protein DRJ03_07950 [Chloroflexota bacterium]